MVVYEWIYQASLDLSGMMEIYLKIGKNTKLATGKQNRYFLMKLPVASYGVSKKEIHDHHSINCCNCFFGLPCFLT